MVKERDNYIDNIRVLLTALVILHHTAIAFGAPGSWYYKENADGLASGLLLTVFVSTNQAFFMGLFFFLSSYFIPSSYERKGPKKFIIDRFVRLGIPLIFYSLVIAPTTIYLVIRLGYDEQISFVDYYTHRENWIDVGVLWFTAALLFFTMFYYVIRLLVSDKQTKLVAPLPNTNFILVFSLVLGLVSFIIRLVFPIGDTLSPLGFQLAYFTQYIALFSIGILAYNSNWLSCVTLAQGRRWLWLAVFLVVVGFPAIYALKLVTHSEFEAFLGGFTIQSFVNSIWEQLLGISMIVAVLAIAKHKWNDQSSFMKKLARSAYAVYIIHPMVLVLISLLFRDVLLASLLKFVIIGTLSVSLSFALGFLITRIPVVNKVV